MGEGSTPNAPSECTVATASAPQFDYGCQRDEHLANVFLRSMMMLCCGIYLIVNMPAPSSHDDPFLLSLKSVCLNRGEHI
jgi:hypothetical protein